MKKGDRVNTQDGPGEVVGLEHCHTVTRVLVKHDTYPPKRVPGMFKDDVLAYFQSEVQPA